MILSSASPLSWGLGLSAAFAYALTAAAGQRFGLGALRTLLTGAWLLHGALLALGLASEPPRFGFATAISFTAWLVLTIYGVESQLFPRMRARWAMAGLGGIAVLLGLAFPGAPLAPTTSVWLPLHWALGVASYGLFAVAAAHAWLISRVERQIRLAADAHSGIPLLTLERLTFRFIAAGFALLSATLVAGWFFGAGLYGNSATGLRWDHKTIFSLLSWLTIAILLFGRLRYGWRGRKAIRFVYGGAALLLLAYAGSRFVMEVLLGKAA